MILPHPQVLGYMRKKTENYDRWMSGMAKIQAKMRESLREVSGNAASPSLLRRNSKLFARGSVATKQSLAPHAEPWIASLRSQ